MYIRLGLQANFNGKNPLKVAPTRPQRANQAPPRRRVVCTRAQGLFAHATTRGEPAIVVTQTKLTRYKNICASEPENVCTLLAASLIKRACLHLVPPPGSPRLQSIRAALPARPLLAKLADEREAKPLNLRPLNQKPNPPHTIPLIRIQPERQNDARGQGVGMAEPDGVYGLALVF